MNQGVHPLVLDIAEADLSDLRERLARTRWPERETVDDWSQGTRLEYLQELCTYWQTTYDWRRVEARLNAAGQFRTIIDGLGVHFLHAPSPHANALPLVVTHGWPGSVVEFLDVIGPLVDPSAHGGDPADAFHVVCPSLPGFGFSDRPSEIGWGVARIAAAWKELMARLGYERYGAQGGDWGASVTTRLAVLDAEHVAGIHLNMARVSPDVMAAMDTQTPEERAALEAFLAHRASGAGYAALQSTRPQTLGYGLVDSAAGQCAWIVEKLWTWTDWETSLDDVLSRDAVLDNVMLYWLTATGASSGRLYWESYRDPHLDPIHVPTGISVFPKELFRISRRLAETRFRDLRHFNELDRGGHFAAFEQPSLFVDEVRASFRHIR